MVDRNPLVRVRVRVRVDSGPPFRGSARLNRNPNPDPRNGGPPEWEIMVPMEKNITDGAIGAGGEVIGYTQFTTFNSLTTINFMLCIC